jgi:hypothetical protein
MATTSITLVTGHSETVEMSGEDLKAALAEHSPLVALPLTRTRGKPLYVNPAHVVMAREESEDESRPQFARG